MSVLLNTSAQEIEEAIQSLQEHTITTFSLEDAKAEMRQIQYRSNNTKRTIATTVVVAALSLTVAAMLLAAWRKGAQKSSGQQRAQDRHSKTMPSISMSTISAIDTLTSITSSDGKSSPSPQQKDLEELNRPIYLSSTTKKKRGNS